MKIYIISDYKDSHPELKGSELTDELVRICLEKPELVVSRTEKGKPYCEELLNNEGLHFSVSHSKNVFACVEANENIGIDIQHGRNVKVQKLAWRYFTEEEATIITGTGKSETVDDKEFFRLWTRKEAYCKYTGEGLGQAMNKLDVLHRDDVDFIDLMIEDKQGEADCFCSICVKAGK